MFHSIHWKSILCRPFLPPPYPLRQYSHVVSGRFHTAEKHHQPYTVNVKLCYSFWVSAYNNIITPPLVLLCYSLYCNAGWCRLRACKPHHYHHNESLLQTERVPKVGSARGESRRAAGMEQMIALVENHYALSKHRWLGLRVRHWSGEKPDSRRREFRKSNFQIARCTSMQKLLSQRLEFERL